MIQKLERAEKEFEGHHMATRRKIIQSKQKFKKEDYVIV